MDIKVVLNKKEKFKAFVYEKSSFKNDNIIINIKPRKNSQPICSRCEKKAPTYDTRPVRLFKYVPLWGIAVLFAYSMRRVKCKQCGVKVEKVPWAEGKETLTKTFALYLARWAKKLSWQEVANIFDVNWHQVFSAVDYVVQYGLKHRNLAGATAIGVDEIYFGVRRKFMTVVYQLNGDVKSLLYVGHGRSALTLLRFFHDAGRGWCNNIDYVCTDMWKAYLKVIAKKLPNAVHILDRFHLVAKLNDAVDQVRRHESKNLREGGYENVLKDAKYCVLKKAENLSEKQSIKLSEVLQYKLQTVRAYFHKESFNLFWSYSSPYWARWFLRSWCTRVMRSRLDPLKKFVLTIRRHEDLIMNWFKAKKQFSSGAVEGLNRKINLITRKSYGFRSEKALQIALYHNLGELPEPPGTHLF